MIGPHVHMGPIKISWINLIWAWKLSDIQCILTWIYISKSRDIQYSIFDGVCIWRWIKSWWPESRTAADQCLFIPSSISRNHWKKILSTPLSGGAKSTIEIYGNRHQDRDKEEPKDNGEDGMLTRPNCAWKVREMILFNGLCIFYCGRGCVSLESE